MQSILHCTTDRDACPWGSIINGMLPVCVAIMALCTEFTSLGRPLTYQCWICDKWLDIMYTIDWQSPGFTCSVSPTLSSSLNFSLVGSLFSRQSCLHLVINACLSVSVKGPKYVRQAAVCRLSPITVRSWCLREERVANQRSWMEGKLHSNIIQYFIIVTPSHCEYLRTCSSAKELMIDSALCILVEISSYLFWSLFLSLIFALCWFSTSHSFCSSWRERKVLLHFIA